jgi:hypothetical protein
MTFNIILCDVKKLYKIINMINFLDIDLHKMKIKNEYFRSNLIIYFDMLFLNFELLKI